MIRLYGIAASDGIAIGNAYLLHRKRIDAPKRRISVDQIPNEILRFRTAISQADQQLQEIKERLYKAGGEDHTLILQAHQLILQDEQLVEQTVRHIQDEKICAEWALLRSVEKIKQFFESLENDYFRDRRSDVDFVADQILLSIAGKKKSEEVPPSEAIIVANNISPADTARLYRQGIHGLITEVGGRNSHTSIIARSLGIPAIVGVKNLIANIGSGDRLLLDGNRGRIFINPDNGTMARYRRRANDRIRIATLENNQPDLPGETLDGIKINLLSNIEISDEIPLSLSQGAEGIGLYRTEFIYLDRKNLPTEEEHFADALRVLRFAGTSTVTFRTCDLGVDKLPSQLSQAPSSNPALGLRSLRLCLQMRDLFKSQLRGLIRAASHGNMQIMFPMVTDLEELQLAKEIFHESYEELRQQGLTLPKIPLGIMIELPSAAITADLLAKEIDFFSIGTNDLIQYALGVDRTNEQLNHYFRSFHPAILRLIFQITRAAKAAKIPVMICGEMAGDPLMTIPLLGMGIRQLSMRANLIPKIKHIIRGVKMTTARGLARRLLQLPTSEETERQILRTLHSLYPASSFLHFVEEEETTL